MSDIITLLPDHVANQIAAGEVVQRPASVIKELVENAIDSGATKIQVIVKDGGKTLIQVIDNGCGMSENDARMCFERHATSKITKAADLFDLHTMGFRGEAMASIAAIATVEMKTRKYGNDLGTFIRIAGSEVEVQEPVSCPNGTNIMVKNLFYNVPARRKFLKSDGAEMRHIIDEFQHIALGFSHIDMSLVHNDLELFNLPASKIYNRIVYLLGKSASQSLLPVQSETSVAKIKGYIGKPEFARKTAGDQFFFVNNRYMKHPFFYKAVLKAFDQILVPGMIPAFFIYFEVDPATIDINIHPTKTEVKFENEAAIWPILSATVKEALGKFNVGPSIDFNTETSFNIPVFKNDEPAKMPEIKVDVSFNPFETAASSRYSGGYSQVQQKQSTDKDWQTLFSGLEQENTLRPADVENTQQAILSGFSSESNHRFYQLKGKFILTNVKSGLMVIDQKRAHERILYDKYIYKSGSKPGSAQKLLYPERIELSQGQAAEFIEVLPELNRLGFEIAEFGGNTFVVSAVPAEFPDKAVNKWISEMLLLFEDNPVPFREALRENLVRSLAKFLAIGYGKTLSQEEMSQLNDQLFTCQMPNFTPWGKPIINIIAMDEIEKKFK